MGRQRKETPDKNRDTAKSDDRADRLAEALRANLTRRKAQKRARDAAENETRGKSDESPSER